MSDRHICKAKRKDNGEWVEGFYFCMVHDDGSHVHHFLMPFGADLSLGTSIGNIQVEIVPETVCQCSGVPDKNSRKIFEGDIVRRKVFDEVVVGKVVWFDIGFCGFYLKCGYSFCSVGKDEYTGLSDCDEIIGNIFDNPELLEGGALNE